MITLFLDDVISNIRAAFVDELRKQREQENLSKAVAEPAPVTNSIASTPEIKVINLNAAVVNPRLPIFDISSFHPRLNIPLNDQSYQNVKNDYEMEFIEVPRNPVVLPQKIATGAITNLRPPNLHQERRRRRNPAPIKKLQITRVYPPSTYFQPPFKLL